MFLVKSRAELAALTEYERLRYLANRVWLMVVLGTLFGLQIAFLEGFEVIGLLIIACVMLCIPCGVMFAVRARRLRSDDQPS